MSEFFKSKRKAGITLAALFLVVALACVSIAWLMSDGGAVEAEEPDSQEESSGFEDLAAQDEPEPEPEPVSYNMPYEMRGVFLTPGEDFLTDLTADASAVQAEIEKAVNDAQNFTMNTVIVDTAYADKVIFDSAGAPSLNLGFDVMQYISDAARERNMYVYAIVDASLLDSADAGMLLSVGGSGFSSLSGAIGAFVEDYDVDAVLIDGYSTEEAASESYTAYLTSGGAIGYQNYLRQEPFATVRTAANAVRRYAPGVQIGLLADSVWANEDENEAGSATSATFTSLTDGNADTKAFVESGLVDFVAVKAYGSLTDSAEPFEEVVGWWGNVARDANVPMYVVHASSNICTSQQGWESADQITRQVIQASSVSGFRGSMFNSLNRMVENPNDATATLVKYYNEEVEAAHILTELELTRPEQLTFTTQEPSVTFTGASDPNSPVYINDEQINTDSNGYFTVNIDLEPGQNVFTISHKEKSYTYTITYAVDIIKEITPTGSVATDGNMQITITALGYEEANVSASVNGTTVPMSVDTSYETEDARDSQYRLFVGTYTAPAATENEQHLGAITVTGSWQGMSKTLTGATITVNKRMALADGVPVVITADQARTYPANTLNNIPYSAYYPLPQGAMDYAVGDELSYVTSKGERYNYYVLASGVRVESSDIQATSTTYSGNNAITGMTVHTESGYTYVTLNTQQKITYQIDYDNNNFTINFNYTTSTPGGTHTLDSNPIFNKATFTSDSLTLGMIKQGGFMGFKGYFDASGNLVFRFNNPPSSISSARIAIDPGHGGNDPGALGFLAEYPERVINRAIAGRLAEELQSRGATVLLIDHSSNPSLNNRVAQAENFGADVYVSVHNNTASSANATGTEVYYFYPYSYGMAYSTSASVANSYGTNNRGAKYSYFTVTLSPQFSSVLVECGFLSNLGEYEQLIKQNTQQRIAEGIANGIASGISAAYTGSGASGSQTIGAASQTTATPVEEEQVDIEYFKVEDDGGITMNLGDTYSVRVAISPENAPRTALSWRSSSTSVVSVNDSGMLTANKVGTANITVASPSGFSESVRVTVVESGATTGGTSAGEGGGSVGANTGIALDSATNVQPKENMYALEYREQVTVGITSDAGTVNNSEFSWSSSDSSIATVSASGVVTAKNKTGTVEITATANDGSITLTWQVDVYD